MLPVPVGPWPGNIPQLQQCLLEGMRAMLKAMPRVDASGDWPVLQELTVDLGGIRIHPATTFPQPRPGVERVTGPQCRRWRIMANPLHLGDIAQPRFDLNASGVQSEFLRDDAGRQWLVPVTVAGGTVLAEITEDELNRCFLEAARRLAHAQGFTVEDATVTLKPAGPNTVMLEAEVGARKAFLKGRVRFVGTAVFGSSLDVQLRDLRCQGIGTMGSMAARAIQPYLDRLSSKPIRPVSSLVAGLKLEQFELQQTGNGRLRLNAAIASSAP